MDVSGTARLRRPAASVAAAVCDLATYPQWLGIVRSAVPADAHDDDTGPAWVVELGARVGPFWRTKRVRMVRVSDDLSRVRFERVERDGRSHSAWVLTGDVRPEPASDTCEVHMQLHYGGARWLPLVDAVLREEIRRAGPRLDRYLRSP